MNIKKIIGISIGVLTLILGLSILSIEIGSELSYASFGADFYTYTYKGIKVVAENVYQLTTIVKNGFSFILISIGSWQIYISLFSIPKNNVISSTSVTTTDTNSSSQL